MTKIDSWVKQYLIIYIYLLVAVEDTASLKMLGVNVPQYTLRGEMALLQCQYELGDDRLYSVTWYKDHEEFYRYVPGRRPPQHVYKLEGFRVDHHRSDSQQVLLHSVNLKARGVYRCEVSAEAPSFTSVHGEGRMDVVSLPQEGPQISGEERIYKVGDIVSLNCTSGKSYPPAKLRWFVNDYQVGSEYEAVLQQAPHGLMTSVAGLRFQVGPEHFSSLGRIQVRCVATISTSRDTLVQQRVAPLVDNREALLLVEGSSRCLQAVSPLALLLLCIFVHLFNN